MNDEGKAVFSFEFSAESNWSLLKTENRKLKTASAFIVSKEHPDA